MKTKVFIIAAQILMSISIAVQAEDYYWYKGNKVSLSQHGNQYYIIYMADALSESDKDKIERNGDVYYPEFQNLKWGITKPNAVIEDNEHVLYQSLSYTDDYCDHDMYVTHRFYVNLKGDSYLDTLQSMALQYDAEIEREGAFLYWYILRCKLNSEHNALELANIFYETGLYASSEPEFIGAICQTEGNSQIISDTSLPSASKFLRDGNMFIKIDDKTYTLTGQEVK